MDPNNQAEEDSATGVQALQWARILQFMQKHGFTGLIVLLLFHQLGFFSTAQTYGCGI